MLISVGVELPLRVVVTILECCVTFSGVKLSIRSFVLFIQVETIKLYKLLNTAEKLKYNHSKKLFNWCN